jgi:hypothetical protein
MRSYVVTDPDGATSTIKADDYTTGDGLAAFRNEAGWTVVAIPLTRIARIDVEYGDDPLLTARAELLALQRDGELEALQASIEAAKIKPNREQRRAKR